MIEINLLPGSGKRNRSRGGAKLDVRAALSGALSQVKDPFLVGAVAAVLLAGAALGGMHLTQAAEANTLEESLQKAQQDSMSNAMLIREKRKAEAQRDSVIKQVALIKAFDEKRFIWPHIMDEISRALPPYTWLTSVAQTSAPPANPQTATDEGAELERVRFRIMGNTVDLQALTRFMKLLEASPFVSNVQLVKSSLIIVEGKEITEFQLDAAYETPDPSVVRTVPFTLSVR
jgi:Tfp pilus assembly protein PilN